MTPRPDLPPVVCFSNLDWGYLRYRKQHLMERVARATDVLFVNPPRAMKWRHPSRWGLSAPAGTRLRVLDPPVLPGIRGSALMRALTYRMIAARVRASLKAGVAPILWVYSPHALRFLDLLRPGLVVYDMSDDYSVPTGSVLRDDAEARELQVLDTLERRLLPRADVVFCVSEPLREKAASRGAPHAQVLPNGCDFDAYAEPSPPRRSANPVVGYVGTLAPRVDLELIVSLARARPHWSFQIVGPVTAGAALPEDRPPNLVWAGETAYWDVPARLAGFDACILPLREIEYAYRSSPIQVFDYLAAGKPVVSSPIAQFEAWPSLITIARGADGFAQALDAALASDDITRQRARREFAREHSWDARVASALEIVRDALEKRGEREES